MNMQTRIHAAACMLAATVDRKSLGDALALYQASGASIIQKRNTIPILSTVRIEASPDKLTLTGTDLDMELSIELPAATEGHGTICVGIDALRAAVKGAKGESVRLSDMGGNRASLSSDAGKASLPTLPPADFPDFVKGGDIQLFELDPAVFVRDLNRVSVAISTEETRYYLNGIFFHVGSDEYGQRVLRMAATDGHRLTRATRPADVEAVPDFPDAILPRKAVHWIRRHGLKGARSCSIGFSGSKCVFRAGRMRFVTKLIDGTFPDYSRVIPYAEGHRLTVDSDVLKRAAEASTAHCTDKTRAVTLSAGDGWANAVSVCADNGTGVATVDGLEYQPKPATGDTFVTGFNAKYLADAMGTFAGERVTLTMQDYGCPCRVDSAGQGEFIMVLMPMRVDENPWTPERLRRLNRDAVEVFNEDKAGTSPDLPPKPKPWEMPEHDVPAAPEPVVIPEPEAPAQPDEAPAVEPQPDEAAMFASLQDFKARLGVGTRWRIMRWQDGEWRPSATANGYRTVARMQHRDVAFVASEAVISASEAAAIAKSKSALTWLGFPKRDCWRSDARGLIVTYPDGTPNLRVEPVDVPVEAPQPVEQPAAVPGEVEALRATVAALEARMAAIEAMARGEMPQPIVTHERSPEDAALIERLTVERDEAVERAEKAETLVGKLGRRIAKMARVIAGRRAQIVRLGRDLLIASNRAAEMRAAGETPVLASVPVEDSSPVPAAVDTAPQPLPSHLRGRVQATSPRMVRMGGRMVRVG